MKIKCKISNNKKNINIKEYKGRKIVVFTPHDVVVQRGTNEPIRFLQTGCVCRVYGYDRRKGGAPTCVQDFPKRVNGIYYVVSLLAAEGLAAAGRPTDDLLIPYNVMYDERRNEIVCEDLKVYRPR